MLRAATIFCPVNLWPGSTDLSVEIHVNALCSGDRRIS
jgi:hypothetical protein